MRVRDTLMYIPYSNGNSVHFRPLRHDDCYNKSVQPMPKYYYDAVLVQLHPEMRLARCGEILITTSSKTSSPKLRMKINT